MEEEAKIKKHIESKKSKTITLSKIYTTLKMPYTPQNDKIIHNIIKKLIDEKYIEPLKTSTKNNIGDYEKYKILSRPKENEKQAKEEILKLNSKIKIDYYLKHPKEYIENKETILPISEFIAKEKTEVYLTVNERSYQIYGNEKKLKENEEILKKLGLNYKDLFAYDTYEPFFCYQNPNYSKRENKKILIIENKDTFWTITKIIEETKNQEIYMVIYGEGKKILKSFPYVEKFQVTENDNIQYFGDIDYEGINIYVDLKDRYNKFHISVYKNGYEKILDIEKNPEKVRTKQNINISKINKFLEEFDEQYKKKLRDIFDNNKFIPQEVFNCQFISKI